MRPRKIIKKQRTHSRSLWRQFFLGLVLFFVLGLITAILWYGSRLEPLTIAGTSIAGLQTVPALEVEKIVDAHLNGTYYKLVPKRFIWTYPDKKIINDLKEIPRIKNVKLELGTGRILSIEIEEYQPYALWCDRTSGSNCLFLDYEGYAFAPAPVLSGSLLKRYASSNVELAMGVSPFTKEFIKKTDVISESIREEFSLKTEYIEKTDRFEVNFYQVGGGVLFINLQQEAEVTLSNLRAILQSEDFKHLEADNFEYIDLRFGDKVFVKEIIEETEELEDINETNPEPEA